MLGGCATLPPPTAELTAAQQAVSRANDADADLAYALSAEAQATAELAQRKSEVRHLQGRLQTGGDR
jgi:hypothetical protein